MECKVSHPHVTKCHACHAKRCYVTVETSKNNAFCNVSHRYGNFLPRHQHVHMSRSATPASQNEATSRWKRTKTRPFATFPIGTATFRHDSNTCTCQEVPRLPTQNDATSRLKRAKTVLFTTFPIGTATFRHDSNTSTCHEVPRLPRKMKLRHAGNAQKQCLLQLFP